jgi:hypothetical protein
MNPDVYMMSGVPATVKLYTAGSRLSDVAKYFFPSQKILLPISCVMSLSLTENEYQETLGYQMKNESADLNTIFLTL